MSDASEVLAMAAECGIQIRFRAAYSVELPAAASPAAPLVSVDRLLFSSSRRLPPRHVRFRGKYFPHPASIDALAITNWAVFASANPWLSEPSDALSAVPHLQGVADLDAGVLASSVLLRVPWVTPLAAAVAAGDLPLVSLLLPHWGHVRSQKEDALRVAARTNNADAVSILLRAPAASAFAAASAPGAERLAHQLGHKKAAAAFAEGFTALSWFHPGEPAPWPRRRRNQAPIPLTESDDEVS
jgi:hypothetical protein